MCATALVLLALLGDKTFLRMSPAQADDYHTHVRNAANALPRVFGSWLGIDIPVPEAAVKMLHPNIIVSRQYRNIETNETVTLLLVHVRDARDILGHYPPACYTGQGWKLEPTQAIDWSAAKRIVRGTEYNFTRDRIDGSSRMLVDNFLITRGGETCRDMDGVEQAAKDRQRKFFGAGQVQIVFDTPMSADRRQQIVEEFIAFAEPVLAAISDNKSGAAQ